MNQLQQLPATQKLVGMRFGRLRVVSFNSAAIGGKLWNCLCECGNEVVVKHGKLTTGHTKSCGCLRKEVTAQLKLSHGHARKNRHTKTYERWKGMHQRCSNPKHESYEYYGARGIAVCERWNSYESFFSDMGTAPDGLLIDRIDNNGNYEPGNCRWTDPITSANNRRKRQTTP